MSTFPIINNVIISWSLTLLIVFSEEINCNDEWSNSQCRFNTISCTNSSASSCDINCIGDGSCDGATINCNPSSTNIDCTINCQGTESCRGSIHESKINCPPNTNCSIICDGINSCESIMINCPTNSNCKIIANGQYSLINSEIHCYAKNIQCIIDCNNIQSCTDSIIDARNTSQLTINCANNKNACTNIKLACPPSVDNIKYCQLTGFA